ncbi:MAG: DNA polymerase III subunit chi [Steroidobacteraceae bacterium]|nr:DNA polymerase III subunit chi [Steroidobacteraceae bacterium]
MSATRVDFYVMDTPDPRARLVTACRLAEKAYLQGLRVAVLTSGPAETASMDDVLWTFGDRSFVPHGTWPAEPGFAAATPVLVGSGEVPESHRDVLINLAAEAPADGTGFARICEVVAADEDAKGLARRRWRGYLDAGLAPEMHEIGTARQST